MTEKRPSRHVPMASFPVRDSNEVRFAVKCACGDVFVGDTRTDSLVAHLAHADEKEASERG